WSRAVCEVSHGRTSGVLFARLPGGAALAPSGASGRPGNLSQDDVRSSAWACFTSAEAQREAAWWSRARNDAKNTTQGVFCAGRKHRGPTAVFVHHSSAQSSMVKL